MVRGDDEILLRVRELKSTWRERASAAEALRRLPDQTALELRDAGVTRLLQPRRYGGLESDPGTYYRVVMEIAAACGSTGWTAGIIGVHAWEVSLFPDRLQEEIWGADRDAWISSSYNPGGELVPTKDGYRLSGQWSFSSGCDHASWAILGTYIDRGAGVPPERYHVVLPRSDYEIRDVWHTVGLRGTGSNDIIVRDAFVPSHRALPMMRVHTGDVPGRECNPGPLFRLPFASLFVNVITAPIIGMAEAMLAEGVVRTKTRVSALGPTLTTDPYTVAALGRAASEIDAARVQLLRNVTSMYETACRGNDVSIDVRSRTRRDQVVGSDRALASLDEVFARIGASSIYLSDPVQRIWRDAHTAQHHAANSLERPLFSWTHHEMGLGTTDLLV